jgi:glycosyltransferase involved in cell wall biosynthesis
MRIAPKSGVRRLLVITYHFPPDGAIGGQRWAGLSKYLARLGWEVHVVTASAPGPEQLPPNVYRHFRPRRRTLNDVYKDFADRFRKGSPPHQRIAPENRAPSHRFSPVRPVTAVRRILGSSMSLPDDGRGWVAPAASAARSLLREQKFDAIITSGPPHSAHFAGLAASIGRDVQFWIDLRDPWSLTHKLGAMSDWVSRAERFVLHRLERLVFPRAGRIIVNTPQFALALGATEPDLDVTCLPNGVDPEHLPARDISGVERGSISYVGTLYAGRNLSVVCAAMRLLLSENPEAAATLRLNVAGPMEAQHRRKFEDDIAAAGLSSVVTIHGQLPRSKALELLSRSHLSLVLAQDQPMQVPAKLYESMALCVPTLVIAEEMSAAASEARRIGAMTLDGTNVEGLRSLLEDMLAGRIPTVIEPKTPISHEHLAQEWDDLLRESLHAESDVVEQPRAALTGSA